MASRKKDFYILVVGESGREFVHVIRDSKLENVVKRAKWLQRKLNKGGGCEKIGALWVRI